MSSATVTESENGTGVAKNRTTKVEQYGWTFVDERGTFREIAKDLLNIDHEYQRTSVSAARVNDIAREWSWVGIGCLSVAQRGDGTLWVMDGQHRKLAADKRADVRTLPCMVHRIAGKDNEAGGFLVSNTRRGPVKTAQKFQAMILAKEPVACLVKSIVEHSGYTIVPSATSPFQVACIAALLKAFGEDCQIAERVWELCVSICAGETIKEHVFVGLFYLETRAIKKNQPDSSPIAPHNWEAIHARGQAELMRGIRAAQDYYGKGGERVFAQGIIDVLNHRRRSRKIESAILSTE